MIIWAQYGNCQGLAFPKVALSKMFCTMKVTNHVIGPAGMITVSLGSVKPASNYHELPNVKNPSRYLKSNYLEGLPPCSAAPF